jgi:hypothetical protein
MSYQHWWACYPTETAYVHAWPTILDDTLRIVTRAATAGITVHGPDGYGTPILDQYDGIAVGGDAAHRRHAQPLRLPAPHRNPVPTPCATAPATTGSIDTGRHLYDTVIAAILLRCHPLLGNHFAIRSDGDWDTEWAHGARIGYPGARTLVTDLFGPITGGSPLTWPPQPTHRVEGRPSHA